MTDEPDRSLAEIHWIDAGSPESVVGVLQESGLWAAGERLEAVTTAGEGNMNVTLRVVTSERSLVLKQSRPFVARYDTIAAPEERIHVEAAFYEFARQHPRVAAMMPERIAWIPHRNLLVLEDLGPAADATTLYQHVPPDIAEVLTPLLDWLRSLHDASSGGPPGTLFLNRGLRALNHAHIFDIPFQDPPAIDLDAVCPGLGEASRAVRSDPDVAAAARELGECYLSDGDDLLHGDFYPGSWLLTEQGPRVIDPEFCFPGPREFDYGVLVAHLRLCQSEQTDAIIARIAADESLGLDGALVERFAAVEELRRLLGVAQLPLTLDCAARMRRIDAAAETLRRPPAS